MHVTSAILVLAAAWKWGDWRNIKSYLATMWYVGSMNILYHFFTDGFWLWKYQSSWLSTKEIAIIHTFIVLPFVAFIYCSRLPSTFKKGLLYSFGWIIVSCLWTVIVCITGRLTFHNGYSMWMDIPFYIIMYANIALHQRHPFYTYLISIVVIISYILIFDVPW